MPIPLLAVPAIAQGILGAGQLIGGLIGRKKNKLPGYDIPGQYNTNVNLARSVKNMGMPEGVYNNAKKNIDRSQTAAFNNLRGKNSALAGANYVLQNSNDALQTLDAKAAEIENQNRQVGTQLEIGANSAAAEQNLQKQNWEKFQPYIRKGNESSNNIGSGIQNLFGSLNNATSMGMMGGFKKKNKFQFDPSLLLSMGGNG